MVSISRSNIVSFLILFACVWEAAALRPRRRGSNHRARDLQTRTTRTQTRAAARTFQPQYAELPLDHSGKNTSTFLNRYYVNNDSYAPGGPVFLYHGGEGDIASPDTMGVLIHSPILDLATRFNGTLILWEHRYYGNSTPSNIPIIPENAPIDYQPDPGVLADYYQYLTVNQALADLASFANGSFLGSQNATATPWILASASYPGALVTWARIQYPELFFAAWASSAVINPVLDYWEYFEPIARVIPSNCSQDFQSIADYLDSTIDTNNFTTLDAFFNMLHDDQFDQFLSSSNPLSPANSGNMTQVLEAVYSFMVMPVDSFQTYRLNGGLGLFCDAFETGNFTLAPSDAGYIASYGIQNGLQLFGNITLFYFEELTASPSASDAPYPGYANSTFQTEEWQERNWQWQ